MLHLSQCSDDLLEAWSFALQSRIASLQLDSRDQCGVNLFDRMDQPAPIIEVVDDLLTEPPLSQIDTTSQTQLIDQKLRKRLLTNIVSLYAVLEMDKRQKRENCFYSSLFLYVCHQAFI